MKKRNAFLVIALMMLFGLNINITNVKAKTITRIQCLVQGQKKRLQRSIPKQ